MLSEKHFKEGDIKGAKVFVDEAITLFKNEKILINE